MLIGKSDMPYPYGVEYNPKNNKTPVTVWEGSIGQGRSGADLSIEDALLNKFRLYFERSNTLWFRAILERMAHGEKFTVEEILKHRPQSS